MSTVSEYEQLHNELYARYTKMCNTLDRTIPLVSKEMKQNEKVFDTCIKYYYNSYSPSYYIRHGETWGSMSGTNLYNAIKSSSSAKQFDVKFEPEKLSGYKDGIDTSWVWKNVAEYGVRYEGHSINNGAFRRHTQNASWVRWGNNRTITLYGQMYELNRYTMTQIKQFYDDGFNEACHKSIMKNYIQMYR